MPRAPTALGGLLCLMLGSGSIAACGGAPPVAPTGPSAPIAAEPSAPPIDLSPVPEPPGLVVIGRVSKPDAIVAAVGSWTHLPLPNSRELLRSIADDSVADAVDLSQPIDGAVSVRIARANVDPLVAVSAVVKSFDEARRKLGAQHRMIPGPNGQLKVEGLGANEGRPVAGDRRSEGGRDDEGDDEEEEKTACVLAHAAPAAGGSTAAAPSADPGRLVCGTDEALEALVPYLTRNMPRERWSSELHLEVRPEPVRAPLNDLRAGLPILARGLLGSASPAVRDLVDAAAGEAFDIVNDTQKISFDGQVAGSGVDMAMRLELRDDKSVFARSMTVSDHADVPPPAFFHLPEDTDTAFFGRGSDAKLFVRPRELLANLFVEAMTSGGMPEAERRAAKDLVADRMLALFTNGGTNIYAKGHDAAGVERVLKAHAALKSDDTPGHAEAKKAVLEQVVGWHLYQVSEPLAKVGPMLKDWSSLWNRPAFAKWMTAKVGSPQALPKLRIAPLPVGVTLPKDTVHLEISVPRDDVADARGASLASNGIDSGGGRAAAKPTKAKKVHRSPIVFHVLAVPDGGATWLAFGLDAKLVAEKVSTSLASASDAATLGKSAQHAAVRERLEGAGKINGGGMTTLRGLAVFTALDEGKGTRSVFPMLASLPRKGAAPILFTAHAEPPSATATAGTAVGSLHVSRAVIEDLIKVVVSLR